MIIKLKVKMKDVNVLWLKLDNKIVQKLTELYKSKIRHVSDLNAN